MRVMVCEDEMLISMMLEDDLGDLGHCVTGVATTSGGAIALLRKDPPDFAVVDFQLADGLCFDLMAELKAMRVPFVLVTGSQIDTDDSRIAGVEVLAKPVDMDELKAVLLRLGIEMRRPLTQADPVSQSTRVLTGAEG